MSNVTHDNKELSKRLDGQWREASSASKGWRKLAREDRDFYHGEQWSAADRQDLEGQERPVLVINQIFKAANNLIGRERDGRLDWKALPRGASDVQAADAITQALGFVADQTRSRYAISAAFKDCAIGPVGWLEVGLDDSDPSAEPLFVREEPWANMWHDPHARKLDLSDCRYLIRSKMIDLDLASDAYPDSAEALKRAVGQDAEDSAYGNRPGSDEGSDDSASDSLADTSWCDHDRQRVRLREHWWWVNEKATFWVLPGGVSFASDDPKIDAYMLIQQGAELREGSRRVYKYAVTSGGVILAEGDSPYPFARFPFVAVWAYRDDRGRPFGVVRMQKDPQKELNVSRSRLNESQRSRWAVIRQGAMQPHEIEQFRVDISRSNFVAVVADPQAVQIGSDKADVGGWANLMETARREIDDVAGQNEAAYGDKSNEKSGKAIQVRVAQQGLNMAELFDNLRYARLQVGEMLLALIQHHYTPEKLRRITEAAIVRDDPNQDLAWVGASFANPIEQMRFDVVIDDQAETSTERQAAMEQAIGLLQMAGPLAPSLIPDVIRMSDFPGREEMAAKLEAAMTPAQPPPMAGPPPQMAPTPDAVARGPQELELPPLPPPVLPDGGLPLESGPPGIAT